MKTAITLIQANPSDVEITYQIMCNSIKPYIEKIWTWDDILQQGIHKKKFDISKTRLIVFQGDIVGYIAISENDKEIYIENLLVEKTFQNLGIGNEVMKRIIQESCSEKKPIRLQVFKINTEAQKFYRNLGFERTSEKEFNYEMKRSF